MSNFTFLSKEQCLGKEKLDILEKRGIKATITDFSILLGGYASGIYIDKDNFLEDSDGWYWTKSDDGDNNVCVVYKQGSIYKHDPLDRGSGARPAMIFSDISSIPTNGESGQKAKDGILEVEYGYYPQKAVSRDMQKILEKAFTSSSFSLKKTKNKYTTDSVAYYGKYDTSFQPQNHQEYEYNGKRYVRVKAQFYRNTYKLTLSNGEKYKNEDYVWVEVSPVKWLVDEKSHIMITEAAHFKQIYICGVAHKEENHELLQQRQHQPLGSHYPAYFGNQRSLIQRLHGMRLARTHRARLLHGKKRYARLASRTERLRLLQRISLTRFTASDSANAQKTANMTHKKTTEQRPSFIMSRILLCIKRKFDALRHSARLPPLFLRRESYPRRSTQAIFQAQDIPH